MSQDKKKQNNVIMPKAIETNYFTISLEQIEDRRILEAISRNCSFKNGIQATYYEDNTPIGCIIVGLLINDGTAVIIKDGAEKAEFAFFSQINIEIGFNFINT